MLKTLRSVMRFRKFETDPTVRRLARCANVEDLRRIAERRLPKGVFGYIDGGAEDELTLNRNREAFEDLEFRPRVLRDVTEIDPSTTLLGRRISIPLVLAPTGFGRIACSEGELAVARAAERALVPYSLSTLGTRSIEEVAAVNSGPKWFQVYTFRDRGLVEEMIGRAADAGYEALILTVDLPVHGRRERDLRSGFTLPPKLGLDTLIDGILHPAWTWDLLRSEPITFANVVGRDVADGVEAVSLGDFVSHEFDPNLRWQDVEWMRSIWEGPIVIKGIQTVEDAVLAAEAGVQAVALSNHGGRQLDGAPPPLELVAPVVDRVGDRLEVICDGGVRRGSDIVKAVALGASACMAGRAYLYGLAAGGERGVDLVLEWLVDGVRRTLALTGARSIVELNSDLVRWRTSGGTGRP